ncbi:MAG: macro domain-containing protein [Phycisphaeraceae bacterium]
MELPQFNPSAASDSPSAADHQLNDPVSRISVLVADIPKLDSSLGIDAIVNAANESLLGGGGVDGAIHRAAGPELRQHNQSLGGCPTGLAKRSPAFGLDKQSIQHIFHAVGPVWPPPPEELSEQQQASLVPGAPIDDSAKLGYTYADTLLASCYMQVLTLAVQHNVQHLAIPAISTGSYNFPKPRAARIAFGHAHGHLLRNEHPTQITFVCFNDEDAKHYHEAINTRGQWMVSRGRI